ncbi:LacI family DNA-binding transcriptional regulator [Agromyces sp. Soil535]|uniref:LacI family DNA-binding transcriptional regulator n=1 Tax=Agromyces sp. Soil535 TaxID=1736390 RepID=UPI0006F4E4BE|nr:LacI family DNA-binding transcriptional regulator [Agromyces sp. Soil535]KRE22483.1 LacI family transcriptional regulator [Agromyces sp. Soil535]
MSQTTSTRRVTAADIAHSLGISRATVGFVLNDTPGQTISEATRTRVLDEAKRLGYRPHIAARALASGRTRIVLLVLPDWPLDFNLRRNIEEASLALDEAGYALITYTPHPTGQARPLWETLQPDVVMSMTPFAPGQAESIRAAGVTRLIPDPDAPIADEYPEDGPVLQVQHLYDLGHRAIAFAGSADPRVADLVTVRRRRANDAATSLGLAPLPLPTTDIELTDASASAAIARWRAAGVTAVAAYNDDVAAALVGAGLRMGLSLPRDLSVIGHDDTPLASMFEPRLSTISVNTVGLGRYFAGLALSVVETRPVPTAGPELQVALVSRASTAAPPAV